MRLTALAIGLIALAVAAPAMAQQQMTDPDFVPTVARPAYAADGPNVAIDGSHDNFHTVDGRYAPFAALLRADGYRVRGGTSTFDVNGLVGVDVLVIANAAPSEGGSPFSAREIGALDAWVRSGGRLLLIADHAPFGVAAADLAAQFGVGMGKGWTFEPADNANGLTSQLVYTRENGRLGDHAITRGRNADEAVVAVTAFTGQSLIAPEGATVLMQLGPQAWEAATPQDAPAAVEAMRAGASDNPAVHSAAGRAQGLAFTHGRGRVVVLGEAGMLSAQLVRFDDGRPDVRFGMNTAPGNAQFGLNIMHWLSGLLP
ncbi:hypothetical protein GCM10007859_14170 [Brevundimonas denitrificans]|uniref:DUF4350 domain-containing protein n=1 Tax=Brevundimonas denitrificans TaxID=1443434 RepID=A0ABQ6BHK5_9CAUL|nr:DUF4350 domain-containing protein [Brevundimonas denitrificans]GLS01403.1 hypothetical protein GCM10007859_14170 [Brevundimonas denitrificans]